MSNTKGSMLISNANAVGTELVNQLGGTGYKPSEWSDAINLLGISDDDKVSALAGITEGSYTGNERGAIKYSNCNAVGAMLNKKFSTNRGFKPVEWESAISKLTPLAEGTVSGSICNIVNGAEDVPLKSWFVNIPANLSGVSSIECIQAGKNLLLPNDADIAEVTVNGIKRSYSLNNQEFTFDGTNTKTDSAWLIFNGSNFILDGIKPGATYSFYHNLNSNMYSQLTYYNTQGTLRALVNLAGSVGKNNRTTFTVPNDFDRLRNFQIGVYANATIINETDIVFMITAGSTATAYTPYTAPTVNTVNLGRTVYGADVDVVNGSGSDNCTRIQIKDRTWTITEVGTSFQVFTCNKITTKEANFNFQVEGYENAETYRNYLLDKQCGTYNTTNAMDRIVIRDDSYTTVEDFLTAKGDNYIVYENTSPTTFTFDPITPTPETPSGVSNWWSEQGDGSVTYRKDPDIPDPPVQLLNMNNNENNNNEGV